MIHFRFYLTIVVLLATVGGSPVADAQIKTVNQMTQPKLVKVYGSGGISGLHAYQSGFFVSPDGLIATTWSHVLDGETTVVTADGRKFKTEFIGMDPGLEIALLKIKSTKEACFLANTILKTPYIGQQCFSLSNLFGIAVGDEQQTLMRGTISAITKLDAQLGKFDSAYSGKVIVVDLIANNPGAAGGVLVDAGGKLIGMLGKELREKNTQTWLNYCIPAESVFESIDAIRAGKTIENRKSKPATPFQLKLVGIELVPDVLQNTRPFVDDVTDGSPASKQDIQLDDLILFIDRKPVRSIREVNEAFSNIDRDTTITIVLRRGEQVLTKRLSRLDSK